MLFRVKRKILQLSWRAAFGLLGSSEQVALHEEHGPTTQPQQRLYVTLFIRSLFNDIYQQYRLLSNDSMTAYSGWKTKQ
jgi:hypothetical protein